jgi:hypothetical protein
VAGAQLPRTAARTKSVIQPLVECRNLFMATSF